MLVLLPPVVSVAAPPLLCTKLAAPPPASEPMLLSNPPMSRMLFAFTVVAEFTPKACVDCASRRPPLTAVAPV